MILNCRLEMYIQGRRAVSDRPPGTTDTERVSVWTRDRGDGCLFPGSRHQRRVHGVSHSGPQEGQTPGVSLWYQRQRGSVSLPGAEAPESRAWCLAARPPGTTDGGRVSPGPETRARPLSVQSPSATDTGRVSVASVEAGEPWGKRTPKRKQNPRAKKRRFNEQGVVLALEADRRTDFRRDRKLKRLVAREIAIDTVRFAYSGGRQGEKTSVTGQGPPSAVPPGKPSGGGRASGSDRGRPPNRAEEPGGGRMRAGRDPKWPEGARQGSRRPGEAGKARNGPAQLENRTRNQIGFLANTGMSSASKSGRVI